MASAAHLGEHPCPFNKVAALLFEPSLKAYELLLDRSRQDGHRVGPCAAKNRVKIASPRETANSPSCECAEAALRELKASNKDISAMSETGASTGSLAIGAARPGDDELPPMTSFTGW